MGKRKKKSANEILVAKLGFRGIIIAALIGTVGVIVVAYFGYLGLQKQNSIPINATNTTETNIQPKVDSPQIPTTKSYSSPLNIKESQGFWDAFVSDAEYGKCLYAWNIDDSFRDLWILRAYDTDQESIPYSRRFVLLTAKEIVIRKINIQLITFSHSPDLSGFNLDYFGCTGMGGASSPNIELKTIILDPTIDMYMTVLDTRWTGPSIQSLPYQMEINESISFDISIQGAESGIYTIQAEVEATDFNGIDYNILTTEIILRTLFLAEEEFINLPYKER